MAEKEFDIVVYGATGYTGRLVAEHFVREYFWQAGGAEMGDCGPQPLQAGGRPQS